MALRGMGVPKMPFFGLRTKMMTRYHVMEAQGAFASNPANADAVSEQGEILYAGPIEYPKMMYHPLGEEREIEPERREPSPTGVQIIPAKMEMIYQVVNNDSEEMALRDSGWHDHPAKALVAAGKKAPAISSQQHINSLEAQIAALQKQLLASAKSDEEVSHPERAKTGGKTSVTLPM